MWKKSYKITVQQINSPMKRGVSSDMKKIGIVAVIIGTFIIITSSILNFLNNTAISIIGGSDGPTSVFLAGKVGNTSGIVEMIIGIFILIIGIGIILKIDN